MKNDSEYRLYGLILDKLKELGWDIKSCKNGGQIYAQNEINQNSHLKSVLGMKRPEYVIKITEKDFWVIEAKSDVAKLDLAVEEAKTYAKSINKNPEISCKFVSGVSGSPDSTYLIETWCCVNDNWKQLIINKRNSTGFLSPDQIKKVLFDGTGELLEYDIDENLFNKKTRNINQILHGGAINKRNRAGALACILLALAEDDELPISANAVTLIKDINTRAYSKLLEHGKGEFFDQIKITLPPSSDNHDKYRKALGKSIEILRDLNIGSAINSGRDVLGQFYEQFLAYANDAKELGIVLTPRHITKWAVDMLGVKKDDIVLDPACGTGGFLVAALDKVRKDGGSVDSFNPGNLYGIELDPMIATLALVNMIFRGDGSSNIVEGDSLHSELTKKIDKALMNPPFAISEFEWQFVNIALENMNQNGLLFSVLPTTAMGSGTDARKEITWRKEMLKRHRLVAVVKLPEGLFYPNVQKGTLGVVIQSHQPHNIKLNKVIWGVLEDGITRTKTGKVEAGNKENQGNNMAIIRNAIGNFIATATAPRYIEKQLDCCLLENDCDDLSPEYYIGRSENEFNHIDISFIESNLFAAETEIKKIESGMKSKEVGGCRGFRLSTFIEHFEKGRSGRRKMLADGNLPLISTSERLNGIHAWVNREKVEKIYDKGKITISANGRGCCAFFHSYDFGANSDVFVGTLKPKYSSDLFGVFLCASIISEKWRFNYYRKFSEKQLQRLIVRMPVDNNGEIDLERISNIVKPA